MALIYRLIILFEGPKSNSIYIQSLFSSGGESLRILTVKLLLLFEFLPL